MPTVDNLPTNSLLTTALSPHERYAGSLNHQETALPGICYFWFAIVEFCTAENLKLPTISGHWRYQFQRNNHIGDTKSQSCINYVLRIHKTKQVFYSQPREKKRFFFKYSVENSTRKCSPQLLIEHLGFLVVFWNHICLLR